MVASVPEAQKRSRSQAGLSRQISLRERQRVLVHAGEVRPERRLAHDRLRHLGPRVSHQHRAPAHGEVEEGGPGRVLDLASLAPGDDRAELGGKIELAVGAGGKDLQRSLCGLVHVRFGHGEFLAANKAMPAVSSSLRSFAIMGDHPAVQDDSDALATPQNRQRGSHDAADWPRPSFVPVLATTPLTTASGSRSMTVSNTLAARSGTRRPCSHSLDSTHIEAEAFGEFLTAEPKPLSDRHNSFGGRIVDDPARQLRLTANVGENLAQRRFDLTPEFGAFARHRPETSFLIAATRRDNALVSACVRSSRSDLA